jgi:hypothetical protein
MDAIAVITDLHGQEFPMDFGAVKALQRILEVYS